MPATRKLKRGLDVAVSASMLAAGSPALLAVFLLVRQRMGSPAVFRQLRAGRGGAPFTVLKFRTMNEARDPQGKLLPDSARLTKLGRFLRRTSLDELPQLWNVLRGEMSFVGPRPLYLDYTPYYTARERTRLDVPPGITGLAQVSGRNLLLWDDRLELDAQYAERWSLGLDAWILWRTVKNVLTREGVIDAPGTAQGRLDVVRRERAAQGAAQGAAERVSGGSGA